MHFAESTTPLRVNWDCRQPHQAFTVAVEGMSEWRSYTGPQRLIHQLDIKPAREVALRWRLHGR
jgi:hypothetical protein